VAVSWAAERGPYTLEIHGRIDGVYKRQGKIVVEEIKTTPRSLDQTLSDGAHLHWAQLRVYAALLAMELEIEELLLQLTYMQTDNGEIRTLFREEKAAPLCEYLEGLIEDYLDWIRRIDTWKAERNRSIQKKDFPFVSLRRGQARMMEEVYRTILTRTRSLIQAPTGIGKTVAALFPALRAMAENQIERIFYLTARGTGQNIAERTLDEMHIQGIGVKYLRITAKEKICLNPQKHCSAEECSYARGFYDRLPAARETVFEHQAFGQKKISALAREHHICPFEFSLELALWVDCIICDFNYAFDPRVYLKRFFLDAPLDGVFLVDEAHNLVDRGREMFSGSIRKSRFLEIRRLWSDKNSAIFSIAGKINQALLAKRKAIFPESTLCEKSPPESLIHLLRNYCAALEQGYAILDGADRKQVLLDHYFEILWFLRVAELFDDSYAVCYEARERDLSIKLFCLDPSRHLKAAFARADSAVLYSATLSPLPYFTRILGLGDDAAQCTLASPFPAENLCVVATGAVSTYYRHREVTRNALVQSMGSATTSRPGNYLVFFPSYRYMHMVAPLYAEAFPQHELLVQRNDMSERERSAFLERFSQENNRTLVGFVVLGGIFGEGIDLTGDRLSGAVIVGVGLPGISLERELIRDHFDQDTAEGFGFAYQFPGLIRVCQAAGRVIRSENDRGVVLLIDPRYARPDYLELLPPEWQVEPVASSQEIGQRLRGFWGGGREQECQSPP
jgi:DNA excision repair protein ERCC-2